MVACFLKRRQHGERRRRPGECLFGESPLEGRRFAILDSLILAWEVRQNLILATPEDERCQHAFGARQSLFRERRHSRCTCRLEDEVHGLGSWLKQVGLQELEDGLKGGMGMASDREWDGGSPRAL